MTNIMQEQVTEFHKAMDLAVGTFPTIQYAQLRANLILEETVETLTAMGFQISMAEDGTVYADPTREYDELNLDDIAKELCDLLYVVFGSAVTFGIDLEPLFTAVHANNMTKVGGEIRPDGKRLKPPGYKPVSLHRLIETQRENAEARIPGPGLFDL